MSTQLPPTPSLSRRAALAGLGASGLTLIGHRIAGATGQAGGPLADHPLAGLWLAMSNPLLPDSPQVPTPSLFGVDGSVHLYFGVTQAGPNGVLFGTTAAGTWEADSDRRGRFTAVQVLSDSDGNFVGTVTINGFPEVSEDGQTFIEDFSRAIVVIRDATGAVVQTQGPGADVEPITANKMGVGSPGFPEGTPESGTPVS